MTAARRRWATPVTILLAVSGTGCRTRLIGAIDGRPTVPAVEIDDPGIGSSSSLPTAFPVVVRAGDHRAPADVGTLVKERFFPHDPPFRIDVAFSCGASCPCGGGVYGDPTSIWFNVFFGYYEIHAPKATWRRPFGYSSPSSGRDAIAYRDVVRIGKADWNYFSNFVYGVPIEEVQKNDAVDMSQVRTSYLGRARIGAHEWDTIELDGVRVVSAYVAPGGALRNNDRLSPVWREVFGEPKPNPAFPSSYFTTTMKAVIYMSWNDSHDRRSGEPTYQTYLFGGTINTGYRDRRENARFLELQLEAIRDVIRRSYPDLGFTPGAGSR
jgi:hypothetical protein